MKHLIYIGLHPSDTRLFFWLKKSNSDGLQECFFQCRIVGALDFNCGEHDTASPDVYMWVSLHPSYLVYQFSTLSYLRSSVYNQVIQFRRCESIYLYFILSSTILTDWLSTDKFASNALVAPPCTLQVATSVLFQYHSDRVSERGYHGAFAALWMAVGWILLRTLPSAAGRGVKWAQVWIKIMSDFLAHDLFLIRYFAVCVVASCPSSGPLNIAWALENTETIGKRTVVIGAMVAATRIFPCKLTPPI